MSANKREELSKEEAFDLLNSPRRRFILYYLHRVAEPVELRTLANEVAAWENDLPIEELTEQQQKRVYVSLYQTHIPKLAESGIITYDRESGMVEMTKRAGEVGRFLADEQRRTSWEQYYLALAVVSAGFYALVLFDVWIFADVSTLFAGLLVSVLFILLAVSHYVYTRRNRMSALETLVDER